MLITNDNCINVSRIDSLTSSSSLGLFSNSTKHCIDSVPML